MTDTPDIVARLREWGRSKTHAVISRAGKPVGRFEWRSDATDLQQTVQDAALEIERLQARVEAAEAERSAAYRKGAEAMREAAANSQACGCPQAAKVAALPPNSAKRWNLCGQPNCAAIVAAEIRALPIPGETP